MGQIKGNPALDRTPERQAYTNFYGVGGAAYRDGGMKPVMIDEDDTLQEVVDLTFATDTALSAATVNLSASLEARISNLEIPSKAYNTSNTPYTPSNTGTITFSINLGGDQRGYSVNEIVYFQKFDGSFTGIGTVTGAVNSPEGSRTVSVTQNSGGNASSGNYWVISRYVI
jgi:hypothetical protein